MKCMVLGASGYLGHKIVEKLSAHNHMIYAIYRYHRLDYKYNVNVIQIPIESAIIDNVLQKEEIQWIINCIGVYEKGNISMSDVIWGNLCTPLLFFQKAIDCGIKNFISINTSLPKELSLYSFAKHQLADFGKFYTEKNHITFIDVLLEMFYGEDEPNQRFLVSCCNKILNNEELLLTAGAQKRDIIYIEDVCNALILLLNSDLSGFYSVPLGSGEAVSIREMIEYMKMITHSNSKLCFGAIPSRKNEPDCVADISFLKSLGYEIKYPWNIGLKLLIQNLKG